MAYTLADYARLATDPLKKGVIDVFRRESMIMDMLSFESANALSIEVMRTKALPSIGWRKIGEDHAESKGTFEPVQERVHSLGGYVDIDKMLVKASNTVIDQRAAQTDAFVTSIAYEFNDAFINGSPVTDVDMITGLLYRILNDVSGQNIDAASGSGLDISPDSAGLSANSDIFLDKLDTLMHACDGHKCDMLVMNSTTLLRLYSILRVKGLFASTQDSYGRTVATWGPGGPMLVDIGVKADQSTNIILNTELTAGTAVTGGSATSVYAVKLGQGKYLNGFQEYPLEVYDAGLLEDGVTYRTVIDWTPGIYMVNPRSIARLYGIIAA